MGARQCTVQAPSRFCVLCPLQTQFLNQLIDDRRKENKTDLPSFYVSIHHFLCVYLRGMQGTGVSRADVPPAPWFRRCR